MLAERVGNPGRRMAANESYKEVRSGAQIGDVLFEQIRQLTPKDDNQRYLKQQSLNVMIQLGEERWLMYEQNTVPFPRFLLVILVVWLALLFASFGIFAPGNPLVLGGHFVAATAVCGAILLILAMYNPQGMLIQVSDAPLRAALEALGR